MLMSKVMLSLVSGVCYMETQRSFICAKCISLTKKFEKYPEVQNKKKKKKKNSAFRK